jgi:hypothetical protein
MPHHLAILTDFPEEGWRSMDLCGDMLLDHLPRDGPYTLEGRPPSPAVQPARNPATGGHKTRDPIRAGLGGGRGSGRPRLKPRRARRPSGRGPRPPVRRPACLGRPRSGSVFPRVYTRAGHRAAPRARTQARPDTSRNFSEDRCGIKEEMNGLYTDPQGSSRPG